MDNIQVGQYEVQRAGTGGEGRKRFALTQYFSLTSLLCTALIAVALVWSYQTLSLRDLRILAEDRNIALTHTFANAL